MRTVDDLQAAFELLERQADAYSPDVVPLQAARPSRRRRRRPAVWLTAAAVAAALVLTGTVIWSQAGGRTQSGGQPPDGTPLTADQLTLPFVLDQSSGYRIVQVGMNASSGVTINLANASHRLMLILWPAGYAGQEQHHVSHVDINGARADYSEEYVVSDGVAEASSSVPAGAPAPAPAPTKTSHWSRHVQWTYAPNRKLLLQPLDPLADGDVSKDGLLRVARALDFTHTTPLRTPFQITRAPGGYPLTDVGISYGNDAEVGGYLIAGERSFGVTYRRGHRAGYGITVDRDALVKGDPPDTKPTTVEGRKASWNSGSHTLTVNLGSGIFLHVSQYTWGPESNMTMAEATAVARLVKVTPTPGDPDSWFDAAKALPLN